MFYIYIISLYIYTYILLYNGKRIVWWQRHIMIQTSRSKCRTTNEDLGGGIGILRSMLALVMSWSLMESVPCQARNEALCCWGSWGEKADASISFFLDPSKVSRCSSTGDMIDKNNQETWNIDWLVAGYTLSTENEFYCSLEQYPHVSLLMRIAIPEATIRFPSLLNPPPPGSVTAKGLAIWVWLPM